MAALISAGWILLAMIWPNGGPHEALTIGLVLGTMLGQTTIASAWTALGPEKLALRLPLSIAWVVSLSTVFVVNASLREGLHLGSLALFTATLLMQWSLLQLPFWGLAVHYGLRIRHYTESNQGVDRRSRQFGIRQLMLVTLSVGVLLGIGRVVVSSDPTLADGQVWIPFLFVAVATVIVTLPLLLAALLPRMAIPAVLAVLALVGFATAWEMALLNAIHTGSGVTIADFIWINVVSCAWVMGFAAVIRSCGYGLGMPTSNNKSMVQACPSVVATDDDQAGSNNSSSLPSGSLSQANRP